MNLAIQFIQNILILINYCNYRDIIKEGSDYAIECNSFYNDSQEPQNTSINTYKNNKFHSFEYTFAGVKKGKDKCEFIKNKVICTSFEKGKITKTYERAYDKNEEEISYIYRDETRKIIFERTREFL